MSHDTAPESTPSIGTPPGWTRRAAGPLGHGDTRVEGAGNPVTHRSSGSERDPVLIAVGDRPTSRLDGSRWCGWWRDLIVERYRVAFFDQLVPLPGADRCPWAIRVGLGRAVERSLVGVYGPDVTARLVADALDLAGFGVPAGLTATGGPGPWAELGDGTSTGAGDDELRQAVLGSIADALLGEVPPTTGTDLDLCGRGSEVADADADADADAVAVADAVIDGVVAAATRDAVLAYARHVEEVATRSLTAARAQRL